MTLSDIEKQVQQWTDHIELMLYAGTVDLAGYQQFLRDVYTWAEHAAQTVDDKDAAETIAEQ